ncbi:MAG TPA: hypothetical protein P5056_03435 [Candidatus Paceibacterota bacterium]|nr:hypothetical protein [Candidatus Paceibacterota bacterium]
MNGVSKPPPSSPDNSKPKYSPTFKRMTMPRQITAVIVPENTRHQIVGNIGKSAIVNIAKNKRAKRPNPISTTLLLLP